MRHYSILTAPAEAYQFHSSKGCKVVILQAKVVSACWPTDADATRYMRYGSRRTEILMFSRFGTEARADTSSRPWQYISRLEVQPRGA